MNLWLYKAGWTMLLSVGLLLTLAPWALARGVSCTTTDDKNFQVYRTRCTDGRQFKSQYDRDFGVYRTRDLRPWKKVEPKGRGR
jgi:hypothetical protein